MNIVKTAYVPEFSQSLKEAIRKNEVPECESHEYKEFDIELLKPYIYMASEKDKELYDKILVEEVDYVAF